MATSPNFSWPEPDNTDLVKNGALAIRTAVDAIDSSMADLKGGTTGQVLSKNSNTDMDFTWVAQDDSNAIQNAIVDAKGDLIAATAADTPARLAVGTNGQVLTADSTAATGLAWATPSSSAGYADNGVLNSGFNVWQRGTSVTGAGGGAYTADRWMLYAGGQATASRQATGDTTNLPMIQYCARVQRNSGSSDTTGIPFGQSFETVNSIPFAGKTVTLSFYARKGANFSAASDQIGVTLATGTGTDQNYLSAGYTGAATPISQAVTLTSTWQRFTYSATLAATATELAVRFFFGPTGTAGAADYFEVTGVQLEVGSSATAYHPNQPTYQAELAACQRYYWRTSNSGVNNANLGGTGFSYSTSAGAYWVNNPVAMRTVPSAIDAANLRVYDITGAAVYTATATISTDSTPINGVMNFAVTGIAANRVVRLDANTTGGYLGFSAEL